MGTSKKSQQLDIVGCWHMKQTSATPVVAKSREFQLGESRESSPRKKSLFVPPGYAPGVVAFHSSTTETRIVPMSLEIIWLS